MRRITFAAVALLPLVAAACGGGETGSTASGGDTGTPSSPRVVTVSMTEMKFSPSTLTIAAGETVTFRFTNDGVVRHEAMIGDAADQDAHAAAMAAAGGGHDMGAMGATDTMAGHSDAGHEEVQLTVEPGATKDVTTTFDEAGTLLIGCHQPGHYEAGMKATLTVA